MGGVLVWTHWERVTVPLGEMTGLPPDAIMEAIRTGDFYYPYMRGEFDFDEFHRRVLRHLALTVTSDRLLELWESILEPNPDIGPLVEILKGRYRLAIGSNTDVPHFRRSCQVQPALGQFDENLLSYELGHCKPDPAFFEKGLEKLGVSPQECFFTDDLKENVKAAQSIGITAIQFISTKQLEADLDKLGLL
jgi:epoxide hydrolase-like predicted phosphatase